MRNCYISRNYKTLRSGGGRAKTDFEKIMDHEGFHNLGLPRTTHSNMVIDFFLTLTGVVKAVCTIRRGDVLLLQYPMKKYYEFVCDIAHRRGATVVSLIHDLGSFRRKKLTVEREMRRLAHSDALIVHNATMYQWLKDKGYQGEMVIIGIFDYLSPTPIQSERTLPTSSADYSLFFAGSLSTKSNAYLYMMPPYLGTHKLHLYGNNFDRTQADGSLIEEGFCNDYDLMRHNHGDFGLSWYGESLSEGKGRIGEYMAYNNPHKVGLYLRCHAPVILSKHAGLAPFVEENGIGICIDSLEDIDQVLNSITPEEYNRMKQNAVKVSERLNDGYYFRTAFAKVINQLQLQR